MLRDHNKDGIYDETLQHCLPETTLTFAVAQEMALAIYSECITINHRKKRSEKWEYPGPYI